ncbi:formate dehydrogenase subunit gamma [Pseudohoeflea suaedae]|uniref:Formate dehydrogenase subunit gamma n=1 Tax=Pseudohoeflea suaedae TaxID=877384 RepID=A0A4R5PKN8_9HYPH|nr:formate dehydrogenase subunit gamma [Pseudohoeflea suaedae]
MPATTTDTMIEKARAIVDAHRHLEGPLLPILHAVQAEFGYVPRDVQPAIADALNISRAEIHGVVSFYHDYRSEPAGRHVIRICRSEACQSMGGEAAAASLLQKLGLDWHQTSADGAVTVEPVYCLGLCACSPAAMVDGDVYGRLDDETINDILEEVRT